MQQLWSRLAVITAIAIVGCNCGEHKADPHQATAHVPKKGARVAGGTPTPPIDDPDFGKIKDYVPAEFKSGADRWKDTGVYLDGKLIGMLSFAELPLALKPTWVAVQASAPKRGDHPEETGWRWRQERRYKFTDLLVALGVDLHKVKALHIYGAHLTESFICTGKDLLSKKADNLQFRFGGKTEGKALPVVPHDLGNGIGSDKISAVMVYAEKKPPDFDRTVGFTLDGELVEGVPYYGEPLRGGVRVYLDDKFVAYIKRQELPVAKATVDADGSPHWKLYDVLRDQGVDPKLLDRVVEAWVIRNEQRNERIGGDELPELTFQADAQSSRSSATSGSVLLGPNKYAARAIALHTKAVDPATFPARLPDE